MKLIVKESYSELSRVGAELIKEEIQLKPNLVLGLASGSSPLGCYQELVRFHQEGLDFSQVTVFSLDEYYGLAFNHPQSYYSYYLNNFLSQINIQFRNVHLIDGLASQPEEFALEYERKIKEAGGIDLQILGIGRDGHIAFNEPGTPFDKRTHLTQLAQETIEDNARFFEAKEDVPQSAITLGLGTIVEAKKIILLASGEAKAEVVAKALEGPISSTVPASLLQKHSDLTVVLDSAAAQELKKR